MRTSAGAARIRTPFLVLGLLLLGGCPPRQTPPPINLTVGPGGAQCLRALDFKQPIASLITMDGLRSGDWADNTFVEYVDNVYAPAEQRTKVTHYRITPPSPPTQSDLYVLSSVTGATVNDIARVAIALSPNSTATNGRAIVVQPFANAFAPGPSGSSLDPFQITGYKWNGASWVTDAAVAAAASAKVAYTTASGTWSVEIKIHLPDLGITANEFYMASEWTSEIPTLVGAGQSWLPATADDLSGDEFPDTDPTKWIRYSFGPQCQPDVFIALNWNSCADMYVNARGPDATSININADNQFFADAHGDNDVIDVNADGQPATGVRVFMGISNLGSGVPNSAMNFNHTDPINWLNATATLTTPTPKPPNAFTVAAGAVNTDLRVTWKPASEPGNPFTDGQHVCLRAFVYFKDDPYLDNNFAMCNMQFVNPGASGMVQGDFDIGPYYWYCRPRCPNPFERDIVVLPLITNVTPETGPVWRVELKGGGLQRISDRAFGTRFSRDARAQRVTITFAVPSTIKPPDDRLLTAYQRQTHKVFGDRPLVIVRTFVATTRKMGDRDVRMLRPVSYAGFVVDKRQ